MRMATLLMTGLMFVQIPSLHAESVRSARGGENQRAAEVAFSDSTLQLRLLTDGEKLGIDEGELQLGAFLSEERDVVLTGGLVVPLDLNLGRRMTVSVGPQVFAALLEEENNDVFAVAVGVEVRYVLAGNRQLAVVGSAYYSPDIITFGSADNLTDMAARLEMRVTRTLVGFAGYRWFEMDLLDRQERELQEEFFAGVRWGFE